MKIDWEHIYLLGWYSANRTLNLTHWNGKHPWIDVVVLGATDFDVSKIMWNSPLHGDFSVVQVPAGTNPKWYADHRGGIQAFGWYFENGINRPAPRPLKDEWDWYYTLKGMKGKENGR